MIFGKKAPFFDRVRKADAREIDPVLAPPVEDPAVLTKVIALLTLSAAKLMVESGAPKIGGKRIDRDVFAFEVAMFAGEWIRFHYLNLTQEPETDFMWKAFVHGQLVVGKAADDLCGWNTIDVVKARIEEYRRGDANGMNLDGTLRMVGNATVPMKLYSTPMDLGFDVALMGHIAALSHATAGHAEAILNVVDHYGFDPGRI